MTGTLEIVATGARTPLGLDTESTAAAVRAGLTLFQEFPFVMAGGDPVVASTDTLIDPRVQGRERLLPMIESVLGEVVGTLATGAPYRGHCSLLLALPEARPGFSDDDAGWVASIVGERFRVRDWQIRVAIGGRGHAGAIRATQVAVEEASRGNDALFLVVGADSYHHPDTFVWLERQLRFAQPSIRSGFIPGEGAGCLAVTSSARSRQLGLQPLARIGGVGLGQETLLRDSETGCFGAGMSDAVLAATQGLQLPRDAVDTLYSDINGERYRSEEWGFVAMKTHAVWKSLEYELPGASWGDVGAAFGTLGSVLAVQSYRRRYASGPRAVVMAGSDSGLRGALLLQSPNGHGTNPGAGT